MESNNGLLIVLSGLVLVASIYWWWRFSRMMDDVHRIAEKLDPPPLLTGNDLRSHGLTPGPDFKRLLEVLRQAQLDGRVHTRAEALELVDELGPRPGR